MLLKSGSSGLAVGIVQQRLQDLGLDVTADYIFGPMTLAAVKSFQSQVGIFADGEIGPETLRALDLDQVPLQETLNAWRYLTSFRPPREIQEIIRSKGVNWHVHPIEKGYGEIHLDFFPVKIKSLPVINGRKVTAEKLLWTIRRSFNQFFDRSLVRFEPYDPEDEPRWSDRNPAGAVLHTDFNLVGLNSRNGAVVVSHASPSNFVFSTVWTVDDTSHPMSGNRQIGFLENADHEITFYNRAAERLTVETIAREARLAFESLNTIWHSLQQGISRYVNCYGGMAQVLPQAAISQRFDWHAFRNELHKPVIDWLVGS